MGSGYSSSYSGTNGGSQHYADRYHVVPQELNRDKKNPDIYDSKTGYFKNPTSTDLEKAIHDDKVYINNAKAHGYYTYVLDNEDNIIFGKRANPINSKQRAPHPTLIGGKDPTVQCAGMIEFVNGRIKTVDNRSGHYRPNNKSLEKVYSALQKIHSKHEGTFDKHFIWKEK
ncbi:MAG: hypothetical protein IJM15_01170 [Erysipelotrichaceae bacterium]|nr:hypothetical protein [Erysipelotrichaceae bacterium]